MLGDWLKAQRKARGWTQAQLAAVSGISLDYISHLEIKRHPRPGPVKLSQLAAAFGVSVDRLRRESGLGGLLQAEAQPALRLEDWVKEMVMLGPQLSPAARVTLLHAARAMQKARE